MEKLSKKEFFNLYNSTVQDITRKFITPHIYRNQSHLISHLQENEVSGFTFDEIENLYYTTKKDKLSTITKGHSFTYKPGFFDL